MVHQTRFSRRDVVRTGALCISAALFRPMLAYKQQVRIFDVAKYGAIGNGVTLDTAAIQRAIDEAGASAAGGSKSQVLLRGGKRYLIGTLVMRSNIDFHLADDAELLLSLNREDYLGGLSGSSDTDTMARAEGAAIVAHGAQGLTISGTGTLQGRAREFMSSYDRQNEIWIPKSFRPKMFSLTECSHLEVRDITVAEAPNWGLHLLGCENVLVDNVTVKNLLDVPNCDGIDPDHSRNVEIRNCRIACGDDGVVVKASRQTKDYGPAANIRVSNCVIETQDAGLKIGTETTADIHDVTFENCHIKTGSRGLCIQLRDEGSVYNIDFNNITFESRYFAAPWWGRGEAISFTAIPRSEGHALGSLHHINVRNVTGRAENSVRVWGSPGSRAHDILLDRVDLTLDRWTSYPGGVYDNRPTTAIPALPQHDTVGFSLQDADRVTLRDCSVRWGANPPAYFGQAVQQKDCTGVKLEGFRGTDARPSTITGV